jgi:prepilin signal peptidase PulO-like enzyme (type II secretory pathway)
MDNFLSLSCWQLWFISILFVFSVIDICTRRLPGFLIWLWIAAGLACAIVDHSINPWDSAAGISVGLMHMALFVLVVKNIYGVDKIIGGADCKVLMSVGAWFGWASVLWCMVFASTICFSFFLIRKKSKGIPFVPFILAGLILKIMVVKQ